MDAAVRVGADHCWHPGGVAGSALCDAGRGAIALAKKEALVSKLTSIEDWPEWTSCAATRPAQSPRTSYRSPKVIAYDDVREADLMLAAALCFRAEDKDAIDNAILEKAKATSGRGRRLGFQG